MKTSSVCANIISFLLSDFFDQNWILLTWNNYHLPASLAGSESR